MIMFNMIGISSVAIIIMIILLVIAFITMIITGIITVIGIIPPESFTNRVSLSHGTQNVTALFRTLRHNI